MRSSGSSSAKENKRERNEGAFADPHLEWRRLFSETWGTFLSVFATVGAMMAKAITHGVVGNAAAAAANGLMIMVVIYSMGSVGGAHINPAVTLAFALRRNFPWARVPGYIICQFAGAILACTVLYFLLGSAGNLGATQPQNGTSVLVAAGIEIVLTTGLVTTILATASGARNVGPNAAIAVGGYVALAKLWAGPISGASMNPARSFAPDLLRGEFRTTAIYFVAPLLGAAIGVAFEWLLKGPPTSAGTKAAQGEGR